MRGLLAPEIGVSGPSEKDVPIRPLVGVTYFLPSVDEPPGTHWFHGNRVDAIDLSQMPADIRSWSLNLSDGATDATKRSSYPSLSATIRNVSKFYPVTINEAQFVALVL
jgi:hypothetical protein